MDRNDCHAKAPSFILSPPKPPHASASATSLPSPSANTASSSATTNRDSCGTCPPIQNFASKSWAISQSTQIDTRSEVPTATRNSVEPSMATCVCVPSVGGS